MGGTIIDSLVVELGLDPAKFTKGQQEALDAARKLEEQTLKSGKNIEHSSQRSGDAIAGIRRQALELFAVFTGGKGVVDFSTNLTHANAALGRLERNIGQSAATISKWQGAARIFGGDAAQMAQSFTSMSDAFAGWKIGLVSPVIADLRAVSTAGGKVIDVNKGVEQSFLDLSENLKAIHDRDPAQAGLLGRKLGIDPAFYDLLIQGPAKMQAVLDYVKRIGVATSEDIDAFTELEKRMGLMGLKAESIGRKLLGGEDGIASKIIRLADWLNKSPGDAGRDFLDWISAGQQRAGTPGASSTPKAQKLFGGTIGGAFTSQAEKEQYIRSEAAKRGINPNVAMAVARSEGFNTFKSTIPGETSYSAFQLHVTPGGRGGHLGDQFQSQTGLDPSDPANERAAISFALDDARRNGWKAFHGAKNTGIGQWAGIERGGGNTTTTEVNINGPISVTAPAGADASDFAERFAAAVKRQSFAAQANSGQN
jgi:hypothetical protein